MNRITPELRRLMKWAREAPPTAEPEPPLGFSHRVVHAWLAEEVTDPVLLWENAVWKSAWAAAGVILVGLAVLTAQRLTTSSPYDVSPAYEVVSTDLVP